MAMSKEKKRQAKNKKNAQKPAARKDAAFLEATDPKRNIIVTALIMLATVLIILIVGDLPYNRFSTGMTGASINYEIGKVDAVLAQNLQDSSVQKGLLTGSQTLQVKILTGRHKGESVQASNALSTYNSVVMKAGKYVVVAYDELDTGEYQVRVFNYFRAPFIILMAVLFFTALVVIGGKKGLMSGVGLVYTFVCVLLVFLPLVLRGYSPVFAAIVLVVIVTTAAMVLLNGVTKKTLCAILGTVSGVILAGLILYAFGRLMHITGYSTDDAEALLLIGQTTGLRVKDLLFAGILIASLGAIMDIAISIVSAIHEIYMKLPGIKKAALIRTGMNIGKDMIGTMSNTLILVFTGTSLSLMILLYSYSVQINQLMNMNTIAIEITQALAGSLGMILTVPITAVIAANVYVKEK